MWSAGRGSTEAAFTILELLVVMVIIGLMAVLALPALSRSLDTVRLDGAARGLAAAGRKARSEAMASRTPRWLVVDPAKERYWLSGAPDEKAGPAEDEVRAVPPVVDIIGFMRTDGRAVDGIVRVRFDPNGSSSGGTIRMERAGDGHGRKVREVFFEPFTGLPSVSESALEEGGQW